MGNQRTFASLAWNGKGKVTPRERFLEFGHADFVEMIGSSRPMVSRLIAEMIANKRLLYDGKHYIVLGLEDNGCELNAAESRTKLVLTKSTAPRREQSEYRN